MTNATTRENLGSLIDDRPDEGIFRVNGRVYADPKVFDVELERVFGKTWCYLGHESQVKEPNDWLSTWIGHVPVLLSRDEKGVLRAFHNACRHKGAKLTRTEFGNRRVHSCPYHGWSYGSNGKNTGIKNRDEGRYPASFEAESHDLIPLAQVSAYKGLIFGSLSNDVPPLDEFLGEARFFIDLAMDQGANGMEVVPGKIEYTYNANWKLQMDNGTDVYHLTSTHTSFLDVMVKRAAGAGHQDAKQFDWRKRFLESGGDFQFKNGHGMVWLNQAEVKKRPIYPDIENVRARVGELRAEWMLKLRNITIFPNLQIADATSLLLRTFRPVSVNKTEMRYWCLAPVGEPAAQRAWRLRQFEDFFNVTGFATPDDAVVYETVQAGLASGIDYLQGHVRGMTAITPGANELAEKLGVHPVASVIDNYTLQSETSFMPAYHEWARLMSTEPDAK